MAAAIKQVRSSGGGGGGVGEKRLSKKWKLEKVF